MVIELRVVIRVPDKDEEKFPEVIQKINDLIRNELPDLQAVPMHSPVTVTIRDMSAEVKE